MKITSGIIERPQKVVIHGREGIGKSTIASKFPNPVFTDIEDGTSHLDCKRTPKPSSWAMLREMTREMQRDNHGFQTWVIDTADWAERLCKEHLAATIPEMKNRFGNLGYGKDQMYLADEFGAWLNDLTLVCERGMNIVILAHTHAKRIDLPEATGSYDAWEMKMDRKAAGLLKEWSDMTLFACYEIFVVKDESNMKKGKGTGGKRILRTMTNPAWEAKNRHGLAEVLPLKWESIAHCFPSMNGTPKAEPKAEPKPVVKESLTTEPDGNDDPNLAAIQEAIDKPAETPAIKALKDLMERDEVTISELQGVLAAKGLFPADTPLENIPADFIMGRLVAKWPNVCNAVRNMRATA